MFWLDPYSAELLPKSKGMRAVERTSGEMGSRRPGRKNAVVLGGFAKKKSANVMEHDASLITRAPVPALVVNSQQATPERSATV
jgi:hypothetical protein